MANEDTREAEQAARGHVAQLAFGNMVVQTLRVATRLKVFDLIGDEERSAAELAGAAGAQPQAMNRLLRALAGLGLLAERAPGSFAATPAGTLLDTGRPDSMAALVGMLTDPEILRPWELLEQGIRTGASTFETVFGKDFFSYIKERPELSAQFNAAMSQGTAATAAALPHAFDFGRFTKVTDVGGGDGTLLTAVLRAHPALSGVVYDSEEGLAQAPERLREHGLTSRCALVAGDFFQSVPEGSDVYLIKSVLHDWADDPAATILSNCREVLPPDGRVLIVDPVLPEVVDPRTAGLTYLSDLHMLVGAGGRERTRKDFEELCGRAGLAIVSVRPIDEAYGFGLIEAKAA
ncbi:methyltransferase [Streptomyces venezuelae]|uniref:methyltransferase n=1 Tax=Streptomyces venezuelae TaxID=54571 RepID=UPI0034316026